MAKNKTISVQGFDIVWYEANYNDYISLTDIARYKDAEHTDAIIQNWLRNRNTIELLGFWESIYNPNFKPLEFEGIKQRIIQLFPNAQIFYSISVPHPISYDRRWLITFVPC